MHNFLWSENGFVDVENGMARDYCLPNLQGIKITKHPITRLEFTLKNGFKPKAIVLHRTDSSSAKSTLDAWSNPNNARVDTHFLIDTDGTIYQCANLYKYTQHVGKIRSKVKEAGIWNEKEKKYIVGLEWNPKAFSEYEKTKSYPNRYPINSDSIGIEVVGKCYNTRENRAKIGLNYTQYSGKWQNPKNEQKDSIEILINTLKTIYNIKNNNIYGHGEISAHRTMNEGDALYDK